MNRLRQFPENRFVGTRDDMVCYDCDDPDQFAALNERVVNEDLVTRTMLSSFAPDTAAEARNRGFTPL
jgi:hypothetical protein